MRHRDRGSATRFLVFLWYVPVLIVVAVGLWVSTSSNTATTIVQKSRTFQGTQEASTELEFIRSASYRWNVNLDETFNLTRGSFRNEGDYRAGDVLEIPYDLKGLQGYDLSSIRLRFITTGEKAVLKGFTLRGRACDTPWREVKGEYFCDGPSEVRIPGHSLTSDTFEAIDPEVVLAPNDVQHLLLQIEVEPDIILPVGGYHTSLMIEETGLKVKR